MILKLICVRAALVGLAVAVVTPASAYEASFSIGHYEPSEGVVNGLYHTRTPVYQLGVAVPRDDGLSWATSFLYHNFESRVANLENDVRLFSLNSGFRKQFYEKVPAVPFGIEPFFGLGAGAASLYIKPENENTETSYSETTSHGFSYFWELGAVITNFGMEKFDLELKMTELTVGRKLFGNLNIGGQILSIGSVYHF